MTFFFGWGTLIQVLWGCLLAVGFEAAIIKLRKRPVSFYLQDYSAVVTAVLLGLAIPPFAPWWVMFVGILFAIAIAKHMYGGMGSNPFQPGHGSLCTTTGVLPGPDDQLERPVCHGR